MILEEYRFHIDYSICHYQVEGVEAAQKIVIAVDKEFTEPALCHCEKPQESEVHALPLSN